MLARGGYTGIKQVFEQPYGGFLSVFGEGHDPDPSQIDSELGERWETERIAVKPYAAMGGLHAAIDAVADIRDRRALHAKEIASVDVELSATVYHHGWWPPERPLTPTGAQMNIGYVLAVAIIDGETLHAHQQAARSILTPLSNRQITAKYRQLTRGVIDADRQRRLEQLVLSIDTLPHLHGLEMLLSPPVTSPLEPRGETRAA
jgi:2-methylcitrate dehydratase PrpD